MSVKFWQVIWTIGQWFDDSLTVALMPGSEAVTLSTLYVTDDVINYVISAWYIVGPILLSAIVGMAGYSAGMHMNSVAKNTMESGDNAGNRGGREAESQARKRVRKK